MAAMLAAAQRPALVASLAVLEPPAFGVLGDDEAVRNAVAELDVLRKQYAGDYDGFVRAFAAWVGSPGPLPKPLPPSVVTGARLAFHQRAPDEAAIPLNVLRAAAFPKLVVSRDGHPILTTVCDVLERAPSARRAHVSGAGHLVPFAGPALNDVLERFWTATDPRS